MAVSEKSANVLVHNKGAAPSGRVAGSEAEALGKRLWTDMILKPSAAAVNYNLAMCDIQRGDSENAKVALERVLAADPTYLDAAQRLSALCTSPAATT